MIDIIDFTYHREGSRLLRAEEGEVGEVERSGESSMEHLVEETRMEDRSELRELEDLFAWATKVGWGEILSEEFVYLEDTDDDPLLVRRSAVTSIWPSGKNSTTYIALGGKRIAVRGSYEATIAKVLGAEFRLRQA
jgi:hypothetical protein